MANREACELMIEQEIESGLADGKTPYAIGQQLSVWVAKLFETKIPPGTLKQRAQRQKTKMGTNVPKKSKPKEKQTLTTAEPLTDSGGKREGAGRPERKEKSEKTDCHCGVCGAEFKDSEPMWHCAMCADHWSMKVSECLNCRQDGRPDDRVPHTIEARDEGETHKPEEKSNGEIEQDETAMEQAQKAIEIMGQINEDDPDRGPAFDFLGDWLVENV